MNISNQTPLLDQITDTSMIRDLQLRELRQLADELRHETIDAVSTTGGHLGAGLGVVELTVAIHHIFNTPHDRLIWDVGHQCYPHKILTGRRDRIRTLRKKDGLSGFTKRAESDYDPFGAAHSSTSISAGLGMAVARDLKDEERDVVCVIGDGALSAGMAYEALNNAGARANRLIVILNDNRMSIAPPVGAMSTYLTRIMASQTYRTARGTALDLATRLPRTFSTTARKLEEYAKGIVAGSTLFEELGFYYIGPVDGHDLNQLVPILKKIHDTDEDVPVLLHCITQKGKGYAPAEVAADRYHGVSGFDVATGKQSKPKAAAPSYTSVFATALIAEARADNRICAITAAMPSGTGVDKFASYFPDRSFDVGIAEQHGVTFAAGLACEGLKPFAAIYSTFLQRGYDQVVHDVAIQRLPVRFAIDRAGLVGADGPTHAGAFDVAYLGTLPGFVTMAASDELELMHMVATAAQIDDRPSAFRYPRGEGIGVELPQRGTPLEIGRGRVLREGTSAAILSYGARMQECLAASETLEKQGVSTTVADARFCTPLDEDLVRRLARDHYALILIEEGSIGGFCSHVLNFLASNDLLDRGLRVRPMILPAKFIDQAKPQDMYDEAGLNAAHICNAVMNAMGLDNAAGSAAAGATAA